MKNPLNYQTTEYDCGPTTMQNAISFLFHREEISPDVTKCISQYCLDYYNEKGEAYKSGTSGMAMNFLSGWLNHFGKVRQWPIYSEMITGEQVYIGQNSPITGCLQQNGVVVAKVLLEQWHYVLLTGIDKHWVSLFDPYYEEVPFEKPDIRMIWDHPKEMNRMVTHELLNGEDMEDYMLGPIEMRESVLLYNTSTRRNEDSIEYII